MATLLATLLADNLFDNGLENILQVLSVFGTPAENPGLCLRLRETHYRTTISDDHWIEVMHEITFFQLFRLKKATFLKLHNIIIENDEHNLIKKKYVGGRYPVSSEKSLLVFLWFIPHPDFLHSIGNRFNIVPSTVMKIVNACLYIVVRLKHKYIFWPKTPEEFEHIENGFTTYPGVIGAIDGSHINLKVPTTQHDSYIDRYVQHSINLMAICTSQHILTYIFIGFPGSAHDSRVFSNSQFFQNIEARNSGHTTQLLLVFEMKMLQRSLLMRIVECLLLPITTLEFTSDVIVPHSKILTAVMTVSKNQIWSAKKLTDYDNAATECVLKIMRKYKALFKNKKSLKGKLWEKYVLK
ncbi:hypothetical protein Zmor_015050 [Zophobas morio]|uniref:DDE Tnp4 domain-containing protein n=1 Tax=Zophobas morio TaxID=2755281 RepID=A0AA38MH84_9CUCU|nr:hypothetical protein Zmor_015050 [Zophobas morio]